MLSRSFFGLNALFRKYLPYSKLPTPFAQVFAPMLCAHRARGTALLRCSMSRGYASKGVSDSWWYARRASKARLREARAEAARAEAARAREEELAEADTKRGDKWPEWVEQTTYTRCRPSPSVFDESDVTALLTREMRGFMDRVSAQPPDPWFHRQSEKLVLAALMVHAEDDDGVRRPQFVFGLNAEVSLPAGGSFCAERSAIVAARARFPGISRADFAGIAVLQVPLSSGGIATNPLRPCGACSEWLLKLGEQIPRF